MRSMSTPVVHQLKLTSFSRGIERTTRKPLRGTKGTCICGWTHTINVAPRSGGQDAIRVAYTHHLNGDTR